MAKTATEPARRRRRLTAEAHKSSILAAARRAFTETGDMNGTTIKLIAEHSGISEGVIYRHSRARTSFSSGPSSSRCSAPWTNSWPRPSSRTPTGRRRPNASSPDRLAQAWREVEGRYGFPFESPDIAARAVMGMALLLALESHHAREFDRGRAVSKISEGTVKGFFPQLVPAQPVGASGEG